MTSNQLVKIFDTLRPEGVDITPSSDMSSTTTIRANWRWPDTCPSDEELQATWEMISGEVEEKEAELVEIKSYFNSGMTLEQMVVALWKKVVEDDPTQVDVLSVKRNSMLSQQNLTK